MPEPSFDPEAKIQAIQELSLTLYHADIDYLIGEKKLGQALSFEPARRQLENLQRFARMIGSFPLRELPTYMLQDLEASLKSIDSVFRLCTEFDALKENAPSRREDVINRIRQVEKSVPGSLVAPSALAQSLRVAPSEEAIELDRLREELAAAQQKLMELFETSQRQVVAYREEGQKVLSELQQAAATTAVTRHSKEFTIRFHEHDKRAVGFLIATASSAAAVAFFAFDPLHWFPPPSEPSTEQLVSFAVSRLLHLAVPLIALVFCSKQFAAERHNYVVNKHRATALATYEALAEGAKTDSARDIVLTAAAQAIFGPQATGFLKSGVELHQVPIGALFGQNKS
jgi:hypothetical protein